MAQASTSTKSQTESATEQSGKSKDTALQLASDTTISRQLSRALQPRGLDRFYTVNANGACEVKCNLCGWKPPKYIKWSYQRWKALDIHKTLGMHLKHPPKFKVIEGKK